MSLSDTLDYLYDNSQNKVIYVHIWFMNSWLCDYVTLSKPYVYGKTTNHRFTLAARNHGHAGIT